jgi:peroxiredoxin Q/BCP
MMNEQHLQEGEQAPDFILLGQDSKMVRLWDYRGHKVFVYFYPKADTPVCTRQSCGLRDVKGDVGDTVILGISPDEPEAQKSFDQKYGLGFPLLSDPDHATAEAYGVWGERSVDGKKYMGIIRSAFLVDENGTLARVWYKISSDDTPKNLLETLGV